MKRILIVIGIVLVLFLAVLGVAPLLFKDQLNTLVRRTVNEQIKGKVEFADLGLSFFRNFPYATVYLEELRLIGTEEFKQDTLIQAHEISLKANPLGLLGSSLSVHNITLDRPKIHAIVLENGKANWDIMAASDTATTAEPESSSDYQFNLNSYEIQNAHIRYEDATYPMLVNAIGVDHSGSGAFSATEYDLNTLTKAEKLTVDYAGVEYLYEAALDAKILSHIKNGAAMEIHLKDNEIRINDFPLSISGDVLYAPEAIELDLSYAHTEGASVKSVYSLIPGAYTEAYSGLESDGDMKFSGTVKGTYAEDRYPGFSLAMNVQDGSLHYPKLPDRISDIQVDMEVQNPDGDLEKTEIDIQKFEAKLGNNPLSMNMLIKGLEVMGIEGSVAAALDLGSLAQALPLQGNELEGQFNLQGTIDGVYDANAGRFPAVDAVMSMANGYVKSVAYPEAELTQLNFDASLKNPDGSMANTVFSMPSVDFLLGGEPIRGSVWVDHFEDPHYKVAATGNLDLEKLLQLYPQEGMSLSGQVFVDALEAEGKLSDVEAGRYERLPTSGKARVQNVLYQQADLPHPLSIDQGTATFTPRRLEMESISGRAGASDFQVDGYVENYLSYALGSSQELKGVWALTANQIDVNEWMLEGGDPESLPDSAEAYEVIPIPEGVDLLIQSQIGSLKYKDLNLENVTGVMEVVDQSLLMDQVNFGLLGGQVGMRGSYQTLPYQDPAFTFALNVEEMGFLEAITHFDIVKRFAPVAGFVQGLFNTDFSIRGNLNENMYPVLEGISSAGLFEVIQGSFKDLPLLNLVSEKTRLAGIKDLKLDHVAGHFTIEDGNLIVEPFEFTHNDMKFSVGGKQNITGKLDYSLAMAVPAGKAGDAVFTALSDLAGTPIRQDTLDFVLGIGGTFSQPQISGVTTRTADVVKDQVTDALKDKLTEKAGDILEVETDSTLIGEVVKDGSIDSLSQVVETGKEVIKDSLASKAEAKQDELKGEIDKALEEKLGKDTKDKLDSLKDKLGLPFLKKKKKN